MFYAIIFKNKERVELSTIEIWNSNEFLIEGFPQGRVIYYNEDLERVRDFVKGYRYTDN